MHCNICQTEQPEENFYFHRPGEREHRCKKCKNKLANRPELVERRKLRQKKYRSTEAGRIGANRRISEYRKRHPFRVKASRKAWLSRPENRIRVNLSVRLVHLLKGETKSDSFPVLLGCSLPSLRMWLAAQFQPGMSWENYGLKWEVDHKKPCAVFDLTDPAQQKACFHYTNLQPLFVSDNRRKNAKWK